MPCSTPTEHRYDMERIDRGHEVDTENILRLFYMLRVFSLLVPFLEVRERW